MKNKWWMTASLDLGAPSNGERRFKILAYSGGKLKIDNYPVPVVLDLAGLEIRAGLPILVDHKPTSDATLGQVQQAVNDGRTLTLEGAVTGVSQMVNAVLRMADGGHQWEASVGAVPEHESMELVDRGQVMQVNGQQLQGPFILARKSMLRETSVLPMGADPSTSVNLAAMAAGLMKGAAMPTFEEWVTSLGLDPATLTDAAKMALQAQYNLTMQAPAMPAPAADAPAAPVDATMGGDPEKKDEPAVAASARVDIQASGGTGQRTQQSQRSADPVQAARDQIADVYSNAAAIRARCGSAGEQFVAAAIRQGWDADRAELEMFRQQSRSGGAPSAHVTSHDGTCTIQALQGAMLLRAGLSLENPSYQSQRAIALGLPQWLRAGLNTDQRQRAMDAAWRFRDMSMVDLARESLRLDGREAPHSRSEMIRAAMSGGSLTSIFTTNVNTQILTTYEETGDTTEGWTKTTEVADFKLNERPRMLKGPSLNKLPRGGTADDLTRDDAGESFRIARYAGKFTVDEQDMIDDTFGALTDQPSEMGLAAARLCPDLVYSILLANPSLAATSRELFNVTDGNLGSSSALAGPTLKTAIQAMFLLRENNVNLGLQADHLIVPPSLEFTAYELLQSPTIVIAGTAGSVTERGSMNTLSKKSIKVVPEVRLENGVIDPDSGTTYGGSATTWFLACAMAHTILVAYLRGSGRAPQVRNWTYDRDGRFGMGWDVKMDIGAKAMDWKGLRKTTA